MTRFWRVGLFLAVLASIPLGLAFQSATGVKADTKNTKTCYDITCSVNELCCITGCPPAPTCLPRRVGKCLPPLPCPPPPASSTGTPGESAR